VKGPQKKVQDCSSSYHLPSADDVDSPRVMILAAKRVKDAAYLVEMMLVREWYQGQGKVMWKE
jgi:hypothetical protein